MFPPRILTVVSNDVLYLVAEEGEPKGQFVAASGFTQEQFVTDLLVRLVYRLAWEAGDGVAATILNEVMPLCDADPWSEGDGGEPRTWHRVENGYRFHPYTLGDLRTVMRCGRPVVFLRRFGDAAFAYVSRGEDGVEIAHAAEVSHLVDDLLSNCGISVQKESAELLEFVDEAGNLTY